MVIPWTMALLQSMANLMERRKRHINRRRRRKKLSIQRGTRNEEKTKWKLCSVHTLFLGICELNFVSISLDIRNGFVLVDCSVWVENAHEMKPLNMKNKTFTKQDQVGLAKHTGSDRKKKSLFFSHTKILKITWTANKLVEKKKFELKSQWKDGTRFSI